MKREDCYEMGIDKYVYDVIVEKFGDDAVKSMTAEIIDDIRVEAYTMMSEAVKEFGAVKGLFEQSIEYVYKLKFVF